MLGRGRRNNKEAYRVSENGPGSIHGVRSLLEGGGEISLDGESLMVPESLDDGRHAGLSFPGAVAIFGIGDDMADEVSSINSSVYRPTMGYPTASAVGTRQGAHGAVAPPSSIDGDEEDHAHRDDESPTATPSKDTPPTTTGGMTTTGTTTDHTQQNQKSTTAPLEHSICLPLWIRRAPKWLKLLLLGSMAMLIGSLVLVAVGVTMAFNQNRQPTAAYSNSNNNSLFSTPIPPPTISPSTWTTSAPSLRPSTSLSTGTTMIPTAMPTLSTIATTMSTTSTEPTTNMPTVSLSAEPTQPIDPNALVFYVMAGRYQNSFQTDASRYLSLLPTLDDTSFLVHLGDWNSPTQTNCSEQSFQEVQQQFATSSVPVYFIVGDNDYSDCSSPDVALQYWNKYLVDYQDKYWKPSWTTWRQGGSYNSNFVFSELGVVICGVTVPVVTGAGPKQYQQRLQSNLDWLDANYQYYNNNNAQVFVILAHASPDASSGQLDKTFYNTLFNRILQNYQNMFFVIIHRSNVAEEFGLNTTYDGIPNLWVVSVLGPMWPPVRIAINAKLVQPGVPGTIQVGNDTVSIDQTLWWNRLNIHS